MLNLIENGKGPDGIWSLIVEQRKIADKLRERLQQFDQNSDFGTLLTIITGMSKQEHPDTMTLLLLFSTFAEKAPDRFFTETVRTELTELITIAERIDPALRKAVLDLRFRKYYAHKLEPDQKAN